MKLSILVPSVNSRRCTYLTKCLDSLYGQLESLPDYISDRVEILFLVDNKSRTLGEKRNNLIDIAKGEYVCFVDDDDRVSEDYIKTLFEATFCGYDVISFNSSVSLDGGVSKICDFSIKHKEDSNTQNKYLRIPNHLCCIKKDIVSKIKFSDISLGEDADFAKRVFHLLQSEKKLEKVLYYYDYNSNTTETQKKENIVDLVIISNAKNEELKQMTQNTINSALCEKGVNVIVVEQNKEVKYRNSTTYYKDGEFNYNKFCNFGALKGNSKYIMFANNDLIFKEDWLLELLKVKHNVVSPKCPKDERQKNIKGNSSGYIVGVNFSGWCFMIKRSLWNRIGMFNEDYSFWFSDNVILEQLKEVGETPILVTNSIVEHLGSTTLKSSDRVTADEYTWGQVEKFNKTYNQNHFSNNPHYKEYLDANRDRNNNKKPKRSFRRLF